MENKENALQPEQDLTPEDQLELSEQFLSEEPEQDFTQPPADEAIIPEELLTEDISLEAADPQEEAQLDELLEQFLSEPDEAADPEDATEEAPLTQEALWEDQPVDIPVIAEEIGPDEAALAAAGLERPEELELEQILEDSLQVLEETVSPTDENGDLDDEEDFSLPDEFFLPVEKSESDEPIPEKEPVYTEVDLTGILLPQHVDAIEQEAEPEPEAEETEEAEEIYAPPLSKRRPKNTGTYGFFGIPHMVVTAIWLALILFIGASAGRMIWQVAADMLAFGRPNQTVTITISSNDNLDSIAQKLHDTGLIEYPGVFKIYGKLFNAEKKIKPGTYELNTIFDYLALVKNMSSTATRVSTKVAIPEGYTCRQIFRLLEKNGVCTVEAMEEAIMNADLSEYWFLEGIDQSNPNCLEGYLFPDTYNFYLDHDPEGVLKKLLDNFENRFSETMREKLDLLNETLADMMRSHGLSESYIQNNLFTIKEVVIVASMIEKETSGDEESYFIASVIYNRLTNPGEYPYLNIDAALVYITGRSPITAEDLKLDTPYNTYLYKGLIPGAISNPGLASLNAALSPENSEYYYYALDPSTGSHKFFKTYKAHQNFLESLKNGG